MDECSEFVTSVQASLRAGNTVCALSAFNDNKNSLEVKNNSWDLIPVISEFLTTEHHNENVAVFQCCEELMHIIADNSNPEEAILQFIEEIEESVDDAKFLALLGPLQKLLIRVPTKRINSLAWCFNSIQTYLNKCDVPDDENLSGKEKLLMDSNELSQRISTLYSELLPFYDLFIKELELIQDVPALQERKGIICKFLIQLLGKPLACLDMEVFGDIKSKVRIIAENIVLKIFKTITDPCFVFDMRYESESSDLMKPNRLGTSVLFYLIYSEKVCIEKIPKVYSPVYFFQNTLHLVTILLEMDDSQMCIEKGIKLGQKLLECVQFLKLTYLLLDSEDHSKFCKALAKNIVYNQIEIIRITALSVYKTYINSFETRGFYLLVSNLVSTVNHSGLIGFTITQYKDHLVYEFQDQQNISEYFKGAKLLLLIRKFCYLPKSEETDLIEHSDQIIAALNLLRYLALRDKENLTAIWNHLKLLENIYLKPLRKGIELSRAHYELQINDLLQETASGDKNKSKTAVSINVAGKNMLEMPKNDKLTVLRSSLTAFDMMDSLLSRVIECIELPKC